MLTLNTIKDLRKKTGFSQKEFADLFNVHQTAVSQWETGKTTPDKETIIKIANYFSVSVDYLLGNTDIKKAPDEKSEVSDEDIQFALFGGKVDDETFEDVKRYAAFVKARKEEKEKGI